MQIKLKLARMGGWQMNSVTHPSKESEEKGASQMFTHSNQENAKNESVKNESTPKDLYTEHFASIPDVLTYFTLTLTAKI